MNRLSLCVLGLLALAAFPADAQIAPVSSPTGPVMAGPYIVVDAATGETLLQRDAGALWYPASLTKLMTTYLVFEELKAGRLQLDTPIAMTKTAHDIEGVNLGVPIGGSFTVELGLRALVVRSANDVAAAFGERLGGSGPVFARRMTETAQKLGMTATEFRNANGLPDPAQVTTARDLAILGVALARDFPQYYGYFHTDQLTYGKQHFNHGVKFVDLYSPYADGLKTGFICASGFNLVATATRNGRQLIAVVLGSPSGGARAVKAAELLESGFTQNPLSWLTPALGTVDNLTLINADPPNLHDQVCGPHRKRPPAEDEDADAGGEIAGLNTPFSALLSSLRAPTPKGAALLSDFGSITPTIVYTGPTRTPDQLARLNVTADEPGGGTAHHKKKGGRAVAAKPADGNATGDTASTAKPSADGKTKPAVHWTPTSSSSLAASPPAGLETKSAADKPKKKPQKAATTAKPAPAAAAQ